MIQHSHTTSPVPPAPLDDRAAALVAEAGRLVDAYLVAHAGGQERLIPLLHVLQEALGHVPFAVQEVVADRMGMSPVQVYSVQSFYHFFTLLPRGRFPLRVCMGTACFVRHAKGLVEALEESLRVESGQTTPDGLFSLEQVRCIGACGLAPAMMVGDETHGNLDPKHVKRLISQLRARGRREAAAEARGPSRG